MICCHMWQRLSCWLSQVWDKAKNMHSQKVAEITTSEKKDRNITKQQAVRKEQANSVSCLHVNRSLSASFHSATADSEMKHTRNWADTAGTDEKDVWKRCFATFIRASPKFLTFATHALPRLHFRQLKFIISDRTESVSRCYRLPVRSFPSSIGRWRPNWNS